ncbi:hypothetical protein [Allorhodopirellula heiligendammensis]|uniref:Uncharacterized protein n=1 Tax=Allorhodopirellula heiligendammensis TaxID=2714739 RepID=A0A5C6BYH8_9BACT|nr:hypothetical protein [Allorhodopirellula heiligendammensis]TWU15669.1 hypothetical protein Poly21_28660 [Allorhodopirellula heiligendammensis]
MLQISTILIALSLAASETPARWDFEADEVGSQPQEFYCIETNEAPHAKWEIVRHDGDQVLAQLDVHKKDGPSP